MSLRPPARASRFPALPAGRNFTISFGRGDTIRRWKLPPAAFYAATAVLPVLGTLYLGATGYLFFRDDMIAALMARQARQQYAYEDRLAALRLQIDRITGRQMLDQDSFDGKLRDMISRQARIETRAAMLASLGEALGASAGDLQPRTSIPRAAPSEPPARAHIREIPTPLEAATPIDNPEPGSTRPQFGRFAGCVPPPTPARPRVPRPLSRWGTPHPTRCP